MKASKAVSVSSFGFVPSGGRGKIKILKDENASH